MKKKDHLTTVKKDSDKTYQKKKSLLYSLLMKNEMLSDNLKKETEHLQEIKRLVDSELIIDEKMAKISAIMIWWSNES